MNPPVKTEKIQLIDSVKKKQCWNLLGNCVALSGPSKMGLYGKEKKKGERWAFMEKEEGEAVA